MLNQGEASVGYAVAGGDGTVLPLILSVPAPTEAGSGMAAIRWSANGATWNEVPWTAEGTFTIGYPLAAPAAGVLKTLSVKLRDRAGNLSVSAYADSITVTP